jgi:hypothetical protein
MMVWDICLALVKTGIFIEIYQLSFCVLFWFICAFHLETYSFFSKSFLFYSFF